MQRLDRKKIRELFQDYYDNLFSIFASTRKHKFRVANYANRIAYQHINEDGSVAEPVMFYLRLNRVLTYDMTKYECGSLSTLGKTIISLQKELCHYLIDQGDIVSLEIIHKNMHHRADHFELHLAKHHIELSSVAASYFAEQASQLRVALSESKESSVMHLFLRIRCELFEKEARGLTLLKHFLHKTIDETKNNTDPSHIPSINNLIEEYNQFVRRMINLKKLTPADYLERIQPPRPGLQPKH